MSRYIDVDAFIKSFRKVLPRLKVHVDPDLTPDAYAYLRGGEAIIKDLKKFPSADVKPVTYGCWVPVNESEITGRNPEFAGRDPIGGFECSHCGEEAILNCNDEFVLSDYCPNCGAKMDGENE